ncbi:TRAP transporter small permease [Thalassospira marina]|uniref:TRAP transporter small permease protein n=1 Tax=Thalassospira marina TaxID=2048283 RepID=A0ABM6QHX0_9PROT|nr:TRAP transporter small permease [Thalassospira marina]AUG55940.1 C4-dicarboxylate ABC transporter permease [Thalassospira marina]
MKKRLAQAEFALVSAIFIAIVLLVFVASILRTFGHPLMWSVDMAQLLFIWLCFFGAIRAMRQRGHLGVDLFVRLAPHRYRLVIETGVSLVFVAMLAVLAVEGYDLTILNKQRQFGDSGISYAFVTIAVPVGSVILGGTILSNIIEAWRNRRAEQVLVYSLPEEGVDAIPPVNTPPTTTQEI